MPWRTNTLTEFKSSPSQSDARLDEGLDAAFLQTGNQDNAALFGIESADEDLREWEHVGSCFNGSVLDSDLSGWQAEARRLRLLAPMRTRMGNLDKTLWTQILKRGLQAMS